MLIWCILRKRQNRQRLKTRTLSELGRMIPWYGSLEYCLGRRQSLQLPIIVLGGCNWIQCQPHLVLLLVCGYLTQAVAAQGTLQRCANLFWSTFRWYLMRLFPGPYTAPQVPARSPTNFSDSVLALHVYRPFLPVSAGWGPSGQTRKLSATNFRWPPQSPTSHGQLGAQLTC